MDKVLIDVEEYENLLSAARFLQALENQGVDNWQGYSEAYAEIAEEDA
jgi:hypothetical protein